MYAVNFTFNSGSRLYLSANLAVRTEGEAVANFGNTASFGLSLPEGVTFKSASGVFLSQPPSVVPEPTRVALLIAGLLAMAQVMQRRQ